MYTFLIAVGFFFLLSGVIFGKKIKQHQFQVAGIIFIGTLVTMIIVNGIIGLRTPYSFVKIKEKELKKRTSSIEVVNDSTIKLKGYIDFNLSINKNNEVKNNYIDVTDWVNVYKPERIIVKYTSEDDSIPRREVFQYRKIVDNHWVAPIGVPRGDKIYHFYIPNDSANNEILFYINKYFYVKDSTDSKTLANNEKKKED